MVKRFYNMGFNKNFYLILNVFPIMEHRFYILVTL